MVGSPVGGAVFDRISPDVFGIRGRKFIAGRALTIVVAEDEPWVLISVGVDVLHCVLDRDFSFGASLNYSGHRDLVLNINAFSYVCTFR